jgi:thioredoxin reductase
MATVESIILGAGPYGLSIAAHLRAANLDFRVIGSPMESWRMHMPVGMALKSEPFASNLSDPERRHTLERFRTTHGTAYQPVGAPVPIADFIAYADWFRAQSVPDIKAVKATGVRRSPSGFELLLADGEVVAAKRVIVATGHLAFRHVPVALDHLPGALASHSADHRDLSGFAGRDVTVVGAGQSALETAALLHENGAQVRLLARTSAIDWNPDLNLAPSWLDRLRYPSAGLGPGWRNWMHSELPQAFAYLPARLRARIVATANGPSGAWWLKRRLIGKCQILTASEITAAVERGGRLELTVRSGGDSRQIVTDHVLAATGYKVDLSRLAFLDQALRAGLKSYGGAPVLSAAYESSVPGLHFVGIASAFSFGPAMRFVYGTKHPAATLTAHVRAAARRPKDAVTPHRVRAQSSATFNNR